MWCCKCDKDLSECTCPDLKERLGRAVAGGHVVYRKCVKCGEHYSRCKCLQPEWVDDGRPVDPNDKSGPSKN